MRAEIFAAGIELSWLKRIGAVLCILLAGAAIAFLPLTLSGAIVVGAIVLVLTLIRVEYGLCLLLFAIPFGSLRQISAGPFTISLAEVLTVILFASWLAQMMAQRKVEITFTRLFLPLVVFLTVLLLSTLVASSLSTSLKEVLKWLELAMVFLVVASSVKERRQINLLIGALLAAGLLEALYGMYQFFTRSGPEGFLLGERFLRAFGTFGQPNPFAGYLGLVLPLTLGLAMGAILKRGSFNLRPFFLFGAIALVLLAAILMSLSRGAWLAFSAAISVMAMMVSRRALVYLSLLLFLVAILLGLGAFNALPTPVTARLSIITDYVRIFDVRKVTVTPENWAIVERMANWQAAWGMFSDHPLLGVGIGNYGVVYPHYALEGWENTTGHAHNYYLNLLAETGIVGLGAYLAFWIVAFVYAGKALARVRQARQRYGTISNYGVVLGVLGTMVALSVHNLFDSLYVHSMAAQIGLTLGLMAAIVNIADKETAVVAQAKGQEDVFSIH